MLLRGLRLSDDLKTRLEQAPEVARLSVGECLHPGSDRGKASANGGGRVRFGVRGANRRRLQPDRAGTGLQSLMRLRRQLRLRNDRSAGSSAKGHWRRSYNPPSE